MVCFISHIRQDTKFVCRLLLAVVVLQPASQAVPLSSMNHDHHRACNSLARKFFFFFALKLLGDDGDPGWVIRISTAV